MVGSCNTAGHDGKTGATATKYELALWNLAGFDDNAPWLLVTWKTRTRPSPSWVFKPRLVVAISATNLGFFMWVSSRVGVLHKRTKRPMFNLLDVYSMREVDDKYVGVKNAEAFRGLQLAKGEVCADNNFLCFKAAAITADAMRTRGACLLTMTTTTVNEGTQHGKSTMRANAYMLTHQLVLTGLGAKAHDTEIGMSNAGMTSLYLHGGAKTFTGTMGVEHCSLSDPYGIRWMRKLRDLAAANAAYYAHVEGDGMGNALHDKHMLLADLELCEKSLDNRIRYCESKFEECNRALQAARDKRKAALDAQSEFDRAFSVPDNSPPQAEREAAQRRINMLAAEAQSAEEVAGQKRCALAFRGTNGLNCDKAWILSVEMLRPLLMLWEHQQAVADSAFTSTVALPTKSSRKDSLGWQSTIKVSSLSSVLGFLRTVDDGEQMRRLYASGAYDAPRDGTHSMDVCVNVVAHGMVRRSLAVVGVDLCLPDGEQVVLAVTHVLQYSGHDGASQAQQVERFATILVEFVNRVTGGKVQVLTTNGAWLAMRGHNAFNRIPLFSTEDTDERRAALDSVMRMVTGDDDLPELSHEMELEIKDICDGEYKIARGQTGLLPKRCRRLARVLAVMDIPVELMKPIYGMCEVLNNALFAGKAGKELSVTLQRSALAKRKIEHLEGILEVEEDDEAPKKKKASGPNMLAPWVADALKALGAFCEDAGPFAAAVGHGTVWTKMCEMQAWRLTDPAERQRLERETPAAVGILEHGSASGRAGGIGWVLRDLYGAGTIHRLNGDDARNAKGQHLFYIPKAPEAAAAEAEQQAGRAAAASDASAVVSVSNGSRKQPVRKAGLAALEAARDQHYDDSDDEAFHPDDQPMPFAQLVAAEVEEADDRSVAGSFAGSNIGLYDPDADEAGSDSDDSDCERISEEEQAARALLESINVSSNATGVVWMQSHGFKLCVDPAGNPGLVKMGKTICELGFVAFGWTCWKRTRLSKDQVIKEYNYLAPDGVTHVDRVVNKTGKAGRLTIEDVLMNRKATPRPKRRKGEPKPALLLRVVSDAQCVQDCPRV